MDKDIIGYCSAIAQAKRMVQLGLISPEDYAKVDAVFLEKYSLKKGSLYRDFSLINKENRGNMLD